MSKDRKLAQISVKFETTLRKKYPFAKSLYEITKILNEQMEKEAYGMSNIIKK